MSSVDLQWPESRSPEDALRGFRVQQSREIEERGYEVAEQSARSVTYKRRYLSTLGFVIGLLIFPIGIAVWLFYRQEESFTVIANESEDGRGSVISVHGQAHSKLRSTLAELANMRNAGVEAPALPPLEDEPEVQEVDLSDGPEPEVNRTNGSRPQPHELNGDASPLVREVRDSGLIAEGMRRRLEAESEGDEIDCSEMEHELERIYELAGAPAAFPEALDKVHALADELCEQAGCRRDEALYIAYRRSLTEHRDYMVARGIPRAPAG